MLGSILKRAYLEGLTTQELINVADRFDIDIPSDLDWNFIIEALLDIELEDDNQPLLNIPFSGAVPLPEYYNITFINVLVRDPMWIFAFWEIKRQDKERIENSSDFDGYFLKVLPLSDPKGAWIVNIEQDDTAWYVSIPIPNGVFKVTLCALFGDKEDVLAMSCEFAMPKLFEPQKARLIAEENPLLRLSNVESFSIIRDRERMT
ncbi:MAG: DUF4912 domain-containing protein [Treponema sp.]|jgi:hypothetical protein|nr:DUF4912 domain-containing protein [Treponema sp.]